MKFGAIIIGDEILSGKRQDKHMAKAIERCRTRGLELAWCALSRRRSGTRSPPRIKRTLTLPDVVFSFGGIGATPDDHTRQCAAAAAGVELRLHPDAEAEIRARFVDDPKASRRSGWRWASFRLGSSIIPEPVQPHTGLQPPRTFIFCRASRRWRGR